MADVLDFEITMMTPDEAAAIWKAQTKRAPDFQRYQTFMDARDVGDSFSLPVPDASQENAKAIQYNFNEAARHRTIYLESAEGVKDAFRDSDGVWVVQKAEPVVLRWRRDTETVKQTVTDNGRSAEIDVVRVNRLRALVVSTESVSKRGPRKRTNGTSDASGTTATTDNAVAPQTDSAVTQEPDSAVAPETPQNAPESAPARKGRTPR